MNYSDTDLARDIERIKQIPIIPTLLDIICQTTGMGFAAVARVTHDRWITCSVLDNIQFGLAPGNELNIATTICNEIRDSNQPVVIDNVAEDEQFRDHHTPLIYGFQSYISFPITLKTGAFFGTLCAIDPKPADLKNSKVVGLFAAFSDLISFHLQQTELLEKSDHSIKNLNQQLSHSIDENRQYHHISNHNLQEPLRKIRIFSGMLVDAVKAKDVEKAESLALKIEAGAEKFSVMIKDLSLFSVLDTEDALVEYTDLNEVLTVVKSQLGPQLKLKKAKVNISILPIIQVVAQQFEQLFYHLLHNALRFSKKTEPPVITISCKELVPAERNDQLSAKKQYYNIQITDNGIGIESSQLEKIFDMFSHLPSNMVRQGEGFGLTYCRKIIRNHSGQINIQSEVGVGTTVSIIVPKEKP